MGVIGNTTFFFFGLIIFRNICYISLRVGVIFTQICPTWNKQKFPHLQYLQIMFYNCVKFHKNPISRLGVALTMYNYSPFLCINWINSPSKLLDNNHIPSCISAGSVLQMGGVAVTTCTMYNLFLSFCESASWIISPSKFWTATIYIHAHLLVVYYNIVKLHKNPISCLARAALTIIWTDRQTAWFLYIYTLIPICDGFKN